MSWKDYVTTAALKAANALGDSVAFIKRKTGLAVSDAQVDDLQAKARAASDQIEAVLVELIDDIPGVPNIVAKIAAHAAMQALDAAIAAAGESVKAHN